jgi:hypothetical protein
MDRLCARCQAPLPPAKPSGRPRRFCTDECRYAARDRRHYRGRQVPGVQLLSDDELLAELARMPVPFG